MKTQIGSVLNFWFRDCEPRDWFEKDECFDNKAKNNFGYLVKEALFGHLNTWPKSLDGSLALNKLGIIIHSES